MSHPPVFKFCSMFRSQFMQAFRCGGEFGGVRFASQRNSRQHFATIGLDVAAQVRQRATHANKVIDHDIFATGLDGPRKFSLPSEPRKPISPCVSHHVDLKHAGIDGPAQHFAQLVSKDFWDGIHPFFFVGVGTDQRGFVPVQQIQQALVLLIAHGVVDQHQRRLTASSFSGFIRWMLLHHRFAGVNQRIWKVPPRGSWRAKKFRHPNIVSLPPESSL